MDKAAVFAQHRGLLFSIAYHMLGTAMDAEDMVQEAYLRWQAAEGVTAPKAYLSAIITNLCINQLQLARSQREEYFGPWLPEPLLVDHSADPQDASALAETLSLAFLVVLEQCSPPERAAFLLRQLLDYDYAEIAAILGRSEAACRQLVSRAKSRVRAQRPLSTRPNSSEHSAMLAQFLQAINNADAPQLLQLLAQDSTLISDGGGRASSAIYPLLGPETISRFLLGLAKKSPADFRAQVLPINGQPNLVGYVAREPVFVLVLDVADSAIRNIYIVRNPDKLRKIPHLKE